MLPVSALVLAVLTTWMPLSAPKTAAQFLLFHAPAILALVALSATGTTHRILTRIAVGALVLGLALFSGDLALRALEEHRLDGHPQ